MAKKRTFTYRNKRIVVGDKNDIDRHEVLLEENEDKTLSVYEVNNKGKVVNITGGGGCGLKSVKFKVDQDAYIPIGEVINNSDLGPYIYFPTNEMIIDSIIDNDWDTPITILPEYTRATSSLSSKAHYTVGGLGGMTFIGIKNKEKEVSAPLLSDSIVKYTSDVYGDSFLFPNVYGNDNTSYLNPITFYITVGTNDFENGEIWIKNIKDYPEYTNLDKEVPFTQEGGQADEYIGDLATYIEDNIDFSTINDDKTCLLYIRNYSTNKLEKITEETNILETKYRKAHSEEETEDNYVFSVALYNANNKCTYVFKLIQL